MLLNRREALQKTRSQSVSRHPALAASQNRLNESGRGRTINLLDRDNDGNGAAGHRRKGSTAPHKIGEAADHHHRASPIDATVPVPTPAASNDRRTSFHVIQKVMEQSPGAPNHQGAVTPYAHYSHPPTTPHTGAGYDEVYDEDVGIKSHLLDTLVDMSCNTLDRDAVWDKLLRKGAEVWESQFDEHINLSKELRNDLNRIQKSHRS